MISKERIDNLIEKLKNKKILPYLLVFILILTIFCVYFGKNYKKSNNLNEDDIDNYIENMENKLTSLIENIDGAGKTKVMLTINGGIEQVLAKKTTRQENQNGVTSEENPLIVNGKTVVIKEMYPEIIGAVIVCEGASNIKVVNSIVQATTSLLDIDSEKIQIIKMK